MRQSQTTGTASANHRHRIGSTRTVAAPHANGSDLRRRYARFVPPIIDEIVPGLSEQGFARFESESEEAFETLAAELRGPRAGRLDRAELAPRVRRGARSFSLSHIHGLGAFEAHTDGAHLRRPPRWSVMRLKPGARTGTPTNLWDFLSLALAPERTNFLRRAMFVVRGGGSPFYTSILREHETLPIVRFNRACMSPVTRTSALAADDLVTTLMLTEPIEHRWVDGEILIFDNWRMIHARPSVGRGDAQTRRLERILIGGEA